MAIKVRIEFVLFLACNLWHFLMCSQQSQCIGPVGMGNMVRVCRCVLHSSSFLAYPFGRKRCPPRPERRRIAACSPVSIASDRSVAEPSRHEVSCTSALPPIRCTFWRRYDTLQRYRKGNFYRFRTLGQLAEPDRPHRYPATSSPCRCPPPTAETFHQRSTESLERLLSEQSGHAARIAS